jgi:hypothetical protein
MKSKNEKLQQILRASAKCYYCGLPFKDTKLPKGVPLGKRLNIWQSDVLGTLEERGKPSNTDNWKTILIAHQWCRVKADGCATEALKLALRERLHKQVRITNRVPWLSDHLIKKYEDNGGNIEMLLSLLK